MKRNVLHEIMLFVVPYQYSTSNRNRRLYSSRSDRVVPYQYSTSNRNKFLPPITKLSLFLINILHQTATSRVSWKKALMLFLINILHQTATFRAPSPPVISCSLSIFYIKPQPGKAGDRRYRRCSLSIFYIKPQLPGWSTDTQLIPYQYSTSNRNHNTYFFKTPKVVPYQYSTSNRNRTFVDLQGILLFLINILHQTATRRCCSCCWSMLFLINILHQTATNQYLI